MKIKVFAPALALFLFSFTAPQSAVAQSSSGSYQFTIDDKYTKTLDFAARTVSGNSATGDMTFTDEAPVSYQDVDGTGDPSLKETYAGYYIKVAFDEMVTANKNQAVMSGTIQDSSIRSFIGQRVLLTVEDNGDNTRIPDQMTWGIYNVVKRTWTPSDAELKDDPGVGLRWLATDAERKDDVGVVYPRSEEITSQSFPVAAYGFVDVLRAAGDISVIP
ncbi:MAG TPA: hypothetical protein VF723_11145 [Pyrinomonadaceae bacterium]|jgi:hypothetical protein